MTSVLHPRAHSFTSRSPSSGGILLNPSPYGRLSTLPRSSHPSRSNQSLASSTSSSEDVNTPPSSVHATPLPSLDSSLSPPLTSDEDRIVRSRRDSGAECGASGSRRIRFAPLPDPRRAVLVTEHGEELPLPSVFDDDDPSGVPIPKLRDLHTSPHSSLLLGDGVVTPREVPTIVTSGPSSPVQTSRPSSSPSSHAESPTPSTATITSAALFPSTSSSRLARRLFYPFRQKGGDSRRSGSRDSSSSRDDGPSSWGTPLCHWRSADEGSRTTSANPELLFRLRAQSVTSTTQPKPKRMLNGRVYGARKHPTNGFNNIPDEEPEFVEWGYGGMGSVKAGGMWAKVQSDQKIFIGHDEERGRRGAPQSSPENEDDGSGMGWVKRRREERERKKLEEEAARKAASKSDDDPALTLHSASATTHVPTLVLVGHDISTVMPSQPTHEIDDESSDESDEEVDDEEDDDADQEQHFKQILGAGVERISRHRD